MLNQLTMIWKYRNFWLSLVYMDLNTRYRRSVLGIGWSLMNPLLMTIVFCFVFGAWFDNRDWRHYGPYFLLGLTVFGFVRDCVSAGCHTFFRNENYIRQCALPLSIYTLRTVLGLGIHFVIGLGVSIATIFALLPEMRVAMLGMIWIIIPSVVLLFVFCWSISVLASFVSVYFHDVSQMTEVFFQILFFLTPIVYPASMIVNRGLTLLLSLNPIVAFLEIVRTPLLTGQVPIAWAFTKAGIIATVSACMAMGMIARFERKLIFRL